MDEIIARDEGQKEWAKPDEGQHQCVLVDVIDLGYHDKSFQGVSKGLAQKCAFVFQIEQTNPDTGRRFEPSQEFWVSMYEMANLRKFLETWRGKSYTDEEAKEGAPLHKLEGVNGLMQVEHKPSKANPKRVYANIVSVTPLPRSMQKLAASNYRRSEHWAKKIAVGHAGGNGTPPETQQDDDDDLPF
jgi:hypothetical protein